MGLKDILQPVNFNTRMHEELRRAKDRIRKGEDPASVFVDSSELISRLNQDYGRGGTGPLVSPVRELENLFIELGHSGVLVQPGPPGAKWGPC